MKRRNGRADKHWQHEDTGRVCVSWYKPSARWYAISKRAYYKIVAAMGNHEPVDADSASNDPLALV